MLYLYLPLDLSFKPSNYVSDLIPRPNWMVVVPIFTPYIPIGPSKKTLGFSGSLQWPSNVFNMASHFFFPNVIYLSLYCLKEICALVHYYAYYILHNSQPVYESYWRLHFTLDLRNLYLLQFHYLVIFVAYSWELQKSSESVSLGYSAPGVSSFQFGYVDLDC